MKYFEGQYVFNKDLTLQYRVCHVAHHLGQLAVIDLGQAIANNNVSKPVSFTFDDFESFLTANKLSVGECVLPTELSLSEDDLIRRGKHKWLKKQRKKIEALAPLVFIEGTTEINEENLEKYLYKEGLGLEIEALVESGHHWKVRGAYYNQLNRFIAFGCNPNALLPFRLKNTGTNYLYIKEPGEDNVKRGRGGSQNENSRSQTRGITLLDKTNIKKVITFIKNSLNRKNIVKKAYILFVRTFEVVKDERGHPVLIDNKPQLLPEEFRISKGQFRYHFLKLITKAELTKIVYGNIAFDKDHADKQGSARDGVIGPSYRYEIDATVLDIYVRYSYDTTGRFTMGRPVLYLVIDVYTTMIVGMYIGFHGPDWAGAAEAMINAMSDKVSYAAKFGVIIRPEDWNVHHICFHLTADNGSEYSLYNLRSILRSELGLRVVNIVRAFRGDCKGIVERKFGVLNDAFIHFEPGAITPFQRKDEAHPSNDTLWDLDSLHAAIIEEIIFHNNNADRTHLHDKRAAQLNIGISPQALWDFYIDEEMNGGRPTSPEDQTKIRWAFLREETASVRSTGIYFNGIWYNSQYAKKKKWFLRAKEHGKFDITVRWTKTSTNCIWYRCDEGEIYPLHIDLKKSKRYADERWESALHQQELYKDKKHISEQKSLADEVEKEYRIDELRNKNKAEVDLAEPNSGKAPQTDIEVRKQEQAAIDKHAISQRYKRAFGIDTPTDKPQNIDSDDLDSMIQGATLIEGLGNE